MNVRLLCTFPVNKQSLLPGLRLQFGLGLLVIDNKHLKVDDSSVKLVSLLLSKQQMADVPLLNLIKVKHLCVNILQMIREK